ncbi:MAG: DNA primase catalytic subunit PriS [Candidatus Micrarchaeota archaeon]
MDKELSFILKRFSQYYSSANFYISEIEKREFGVGIEKKIDLRHMGFGSESEFKSFLVNDTPLYVSHSVAYYKLPKAAPMERKGWLGADLVFDLDCETKTKYLSRIDFEKIREHTMRLIEEFLVPDFGISKEKISVNFSGNRGFHVWTYDERFNQLKSNERKEIIEYIKGIGLKYYSFFAQTDVQGRIHGPLPNGIGYAGKFAKKILHILETKPEEISTIFKNEKERQNFINGIKSANWSLAKRTQNIEKKLREIAETELPLRAVNIDSNVTQDPSKLIRVANSIHGGTGLCAKILVLDKLHEFEPLHHALVFSSTPLKIIALEDIPEIEIGGTTQEKIEKGKIKEVPEYFAFYLKLKKSARLLLTTSLPK